MRSVFVVFILVVSSISQTSVSSKDLQLTDKEKGRVWLKHDHMLAAKLALIEAQQKSNEADFAFHQLVNELMTTRKGYTLCGGPQAGICEGAPEDDIVLRKNPDSPNSKDIKDK